MAKLERKVIGEFNGIVGNIGSPNKPDSYSVIAQNWRLDTHGVLMQRRGITHAMQKPVSAAIESVKQVDTDFGPCVVAQYGTFIYANPIGSVPLSAGWSTDSEGDKPGYKHYMRISVQDAMSHEVSPYKHMIPFNGVPVIAGVPSFTTISGGHTVSVAFNKGMDSIFSTLSNTSVQGIHPAIVGVEMLLDGNYAHRWVYEEEGDYENEQFAAVSIPTSKSTWQFRYVFVDGVRGPLTRSATMNK